MNWILYGFKGCGKSYFAKQLGLPYIDTDTIIEKDYGPIVDFVTNKGIEAFRKIETALITSLQVDGCVIALGGGSVLDPDALAHLQMLGQMIYLQCSKEELFKRMQRAHTTFSIESFEDLYSQRIPIYETIPAKWIELEHKTNQQIIEELWRVIDSDKSFVSRPGENHTAKP